MAFFKTYIINWNEATDHCRTKAGAKRLVTIYLKHEKELLDDLQKAYKSKYKLFLGDIVTLNAIRKIEKNIENGIKFYKSL